VASLRTTLAAAKPVDTVEKLAAQAVPAAQQLTSSAVQVVTGGGGGPTELLKQLEEEVGCEDPWNGELTVRMIDMQLIDPVKQAAEVDSWAL